MASWNIPASWTVQEGYPKLNRDENGIDCLTVKAYAEASLTAITAALPAKADTYQSKLFRAARIDTGESGDFCDVELTFAPSEYTGTSFSYEPLDEDVYYMQDGSREIPIEAHDSFVASWTYYKIKRNGTTEEDPTADTRAAFEGLVDHRLVRTLGDVPEGWKSYSTPTKPGVESFIVPSPVITKKHKFSTKALMLASNPGATVGKLADPAQLFGLPASKCLVTSCSVHMDGAYWYTEIQYTFNGNGWDIDIYSTAATTTGA